MNGEKPLYNNHGSEAMKEEYAVAQDEKDPLRHIRDEFIIPTKADLKRTRLPGPDDKNNGYASEPCTYLCGNSLGLQPRRTSEYIQKYLDTWGTKGVYGHFQKLDGALSSPWAHIDDDPKVQTAKIVGALPSEVAVMESLTANLHLLMASFYKPTKERYRIIIEGKAFPSDHYAMLSQLAHHNLPESALICLEPPNEAVPYLPTSHILRAIDEHASCTALLLLPGIQFYSGQFFDIATITAYARSKGIVVGWDLAHAAGNVPLRLHDWDVDFAAWCNYKYMNSGPGAIAGLFVHERHGTVEEAPAHGSDLKAKKLVYRPRLSGWWGSDRNTRFRMEPTFLPIPGAAGFQLSNPSTIDTTAVLASLSVFAMTDMEALREKSTKLTAYLEFLLLNSFEGEEEGERPYNIITPSDPKERGAQLSIRLRPGFLEPVMEILEEAGIVVDERRPDVIRVAPAPLYNGYRDAWHFTKVFKEACERVKVGKAPEAESLMVKGGKDVSAWAEIK